MKKIKFMRRLVSLMFALVLVLSYGFAIASTATAIETTNVGTNPMTVILMWVITGALGIISGVITWLAKKYALPWIQDVLSPWLKSHDLEVLAKVAVEYAETELGRFRGEEKLQMALEFLQEQGWDIDDESIVAFVKAKWKEMDMAQIAAGIKDAIIDTDQPDTGE